MSFQNGPEHETTSLNELLEVKLVYYTDLWKLVRPWVDRIGKLS